MTGGTRVKQSTKARFNMYFNDLGLHSGGIDIPWEHIRGLYICMECRGQSRYPDYIFTREEIDFIVIEAGPWLL